jgi:hypothetical protein
MTLQALIAKTSTTPLPQQPQHEKLQKPPSRKDGEPEIVEFQGCTWKWCDKCFGGSWNRTHVSAEHVPAKGKWNCTHQPAVHNNVDVNNTTPTNNNNTPQANLAQTLSPASVETLLPAPAANIAINVSFNLDFV